MHQVVAERGKSYVGTQRKENGRQRGAGEQENTDPRGKTNAIGFLQGLFTHTVVQTPYAQTGSGKLPSSCT